MIQKLKSSVKRIITGHEPGINAFAQGGEDMMLRSVFRKKLSRHEPGFYIDVGAYHPSYMSNTYSFYISGWRGINIDACPGSMKAFNKIRPRDINLEVGISDSRNTLSYYYISPGSTMNSFSKAFLEEMGMFSHVTKEIPVQVFPLQEIIKKYENEFKQIDILNIDAEGLDLKIVQSNDWGKYRPSVVIVEMNCTTLEDVSKNETAKLLETFGYNVIAKNVILKNVASVFLADQNFDY